MSIFTGDFLCDLKKSASKISPEECTKILPFQSTDYIYPESKKAKRSKMTPLAIESKNIERSKPLEIQFIKAESVSTELQVTGQVKNTRYSV